MKKQKGQGAPSAQHLAEEKLGEAERALAHAAVYIRQIPDRNVASAAFTSLAAVMADNLATLTANLLSRVAFANRDEARP